MKYLPFNQNKLVQAMFGEDWPAVRNIMENESHLIETEDENGVTPLMRAVINNVPDDVLENMIETATVENLEHQNRVGFTILHFLMYYAARVSPLRRVLQRTNTKINTQDKYDGWTPLHYCLLDDDDDLVLSLPLSYEDHKDVAICLITFGASVSIKDKDGYTPLNLYDDNRCSGYEESTRSEKKVQLKELLERLSIPSEILARGTDAIKAFKDALKNGEITVVNSRLMFLGQEGSGKTSCVKAMLGKEFNKDEPSTDGIVTTTVFQTDGEDYSKWEEQEDVDEIERTKQVREHAIAAKVAKTITESPQNESKSKYASLSESESDLAAATSSSDNKGKASPSASTASAVSPRKKPSISRWFFRVFKGNKSQASPGSGAVSANQPMANRAHMNRLSDEIRVKLVENSVSQDTEVSTNQLNEMRKNVIDKLANNSSGPSDVTCIWDYAGQLEYYITHRFFLTDGSSYGVVFSLLDALDEFAKARDPQKGFLGMTNLQSILFWIRSIFEHAVLLHGSQSKNVINGMIASPTISLIGTHKDLLTGSDSEKQAKIEDIFKRIFKEIKGTPYECHIDREMYAVDSTTALDEGIQKLKKNVGSYMKAMARTVPINWMDFQIEVQEAGKTTLRMSLDEITKIATEHAINKEDVIHVINYLKDIGVILHLPSNKKLRNTVITNVHMLIGMFMKIITVVKPNDVDKVPVMMKYWHKLDEEGILEEKLVRYFWRNELSSSEDKDTIFEDFIELMKAFGLLFEKNESNEGSRLFVVPSRMKNTTDDRLEIKRDEKHTVSVYVMPKDFLPDAVYDILIVGFVNLSQDKGCREDPKLFQNQSEIGFDERHYLRLGQISIDNTHSLKIEISRRTEKDERGEDKPTCKPHPIVCMEVLHVLRQHLDEVYLSKKVVGYALKILCSVCSTPEKPHFQELENCLKYELMTCDKSSGNTAMPTAYVQNLFVEDWYVVSERNNFHSVQFIIVDLGTEYMRTFFMKKSHLRRKSDVGKFLIEEMKKNTAWKDVDFEGQELNIFSPDADIDKFDMTTLLLLVQYCFYPSKEESFWVNPPADDNSKLANLVRIYRYKRNFLDCSYSNRISDEEFDHRWKELTALFTGVGVPVENVEIYRNPWRRTGKLMGTDHNLFIEERANFSAINSLVYDVGTQQMRCFFLSQTKVKESDVGTFLIHERNKGRLKSVKFFEDEKDKIFKQNADINTFDITIMMKLIRHYCTGSLYPKDFWETPDESFFIKLANLVRIHQYRNKHLAHCPNTKMSNTKFDQDWRNLTDYLMKSGADSREIKICEKLHNAWTASVT